MKVFLSPLSEYKLSKLLIYIEQEWGRKSKERFLKKLKLKFAQISRHPESNPSTEDFEDIFWCVITPQSSFYYQILEEENEIEVITITDNRQDPDQIIKEIRFHFNK
ncbi:type II toxin-antitoxin system RelE/ParE family toxin [Gracilimonas mengyeensis]|uniref:Plasmid stabilization system protein ParE n=1 Tax=Gracilimonas mengyeensis TaxID=1302730 RepID=A0A521ELC6_9BACT|nr:type II toxin-antitoxin system RelE/ParE family toxin [Gracilimonas mengyeensis]SMO84261.1 Plasmid stabilization system protein ParE [Gracilimonas mengyeensis]